MTSFRVTVLVVGATGSIGRLVVEEAIRRGYAVRALVRSQRRAGRLPPEAQALVGDLTRPETLPTAVAGAEAIVFTHGSEGAGKAGLAIRATWRDARSPKSWFTSSARIVRCARRSS
jgi:uncharacterized protein YbjT (DUF2867 family)